MMTLPITPSAYGIELGNRFLHKLLELCHVKTARELSAHDYSIALDVCSLVDELMVETARVKMDAVSATASTVCDSDSDSNNSDMASETASNSDSDTASSTPTSRSRPCVEATAPSLHPTRTRSEFQSRLKQPTPIRWPSARGPSPVDGEYAPSEHEDVDEGDQSPLATRTKTTAVARKPTTPTNRMSLTQPAKPTKATSTRVAIQKPKSAPVKVRKTTTMPRAIPIKDGERLTRKSTPVPLPLSVPLPLPVTGASKLREPVIMVPHVRMTSSKVAPIPINYGNASECILAHGMAEHEITKAIHQLGEALVWRVQLKDNQLYLNRPPSSRGGPAQVAMTGEDIKTALMTVHDSIAHAVAQSHDILARVSRVWIDWPWLRARQQNIDEDAVHVFHWIADMVRTIDNCLVVGTTVKHASQPPCSPLQSSVDVSVWCNSSYTHQEPCVQTDVHKARAEKTILSPSKRSIVRAEHAVGSFIVHVLGQWAARVKTANTDGEHLSDTIAKLSCASTDVSTSVTRFQKAVEWCGDDCTPATQIWATTLENDYVFAIHTIVESIRQHQLEDQGLATDGLPLPMDSPDETFPGDDRFTLEFYRQTQREIAKLHLQTTQASGKSWEAVDANPFASNPMTEVNRVLESLAAWVDPQFAAKTDLRPLEEIAYKELIIWCQCIRRQMLCMRS